MGWSRCYSHFSITNGRMVFHKHSANSEGERGGIITLLGLRTKGKWRKAAHVEVTRPQGCVELRDHVSSPHPFSSFRPFTPSAPREGHCPGRTKRGERQRQREERMGSERGGEKAAPERGRGSGSRCCSPRLAEPRARQTLSARPAPPPLPPAELSRERRRRGAGGGGGGEAEAAVAEHRQRWGRRWGPRVEGGGGGGGCAWGNGQGVRRRASASGPRRAEGGGGKVREAVRGRREAAMGCGCREPRPHVPGASLAGPRAAAAGSAGSRAVCRGLPGSPRSSAAFVGPVAIGFPPLWVGGMCGRAPICFPLCHCCAALCQCLSAAPRVAARLTCPVPAAFCVPRNLLALKIIIKKKPKSLWIPPHLLWSSTRRNIWSGIVSCLKIWL